MKASIPELASRFARAAASYHEHNDQGDWRGANREAAKAARAFRQLIKHEIPGREALLALLLSDDTSVALMAAAFSLKYNPERSLAALEALSHHPGLIGFEADQAIQRWNEGSWHLE
jgi:hypothetical protein